MTEEKADDMVKMRAECIINYDFMTFEPDLRIKLPLTKGKIYDIDVDPDDPDWVIVIDDNGKEHVFYAARFIKWIVVK